MQAYTWIYSLKHSIDAAEQKALQADFDRFTDQWKSHGTPVDGLIQIRYQRFIIVQADPTVGRPSGCSIDSLKRAVAKILEQHQFETLDAAHVFYRDQEGEIHYAHFKQIPKLLESGAIGPETICFDHSLDQSDDLMKWELPLKDTWMRRYLSVKQ